MPLRITLLGRPRLEHDGTSRRLAGRKTWALLAYLLLEPRAPTRRDLAERLWSEADDPLGAARWALSQVRKALEPGAAIVQRDGRLLVQPGQDILVDAATLLRGEWDEGSVEDLVGGDLLEDMNFDDSPSFDGWLTIQRARVAAAAGEALRSAASLTAHSDPDRALALAERALRRDLFDETMHELVVEIHAARGDRERAAGYVEHVTRRYRDELGIALPASITRALERPIPRTGPLLQLDVQARALLDVAYARFSAGDYAGARDIAVRAARQAAASGDGALEARALIRGAQTYTAGGLGTASEWAGPLQRALRLASEIGDRTAIAWIECERGRIAAIDGRYGAAEAELRRARAIAEEVGDPALAAWTRAMIGVCNADRCEYAAAEEDLRAAIPALPGDEYPMGALARVLLKLGRVAEAKAVADRCVESAERRGRLHALPWALCWAGEARLVEGDIADAADRYGRALVISAETGAPTWQALALRGLALVEHRRGNDAEGLALMKDALVRARRGSYRWAEATILTDLVELERGSDPEHVEAALRIALIAPIPDLVDRLRPFRRSHTLAHTAVC